MTPVRGPAAAEFGGYPAFARRAATATLGT